jgi:hypothetical protein
MKVFSCEGFKGHWPVGTAAVIVAPDKTTAMSMLLEALKAEGLEEQPFEIKLKEVDTQRRSVDILCNGEY